MLLLMSGCWLIDPSQYIEIEHQYHDMGARMHRVRVKAPIV